MQKNPDFIFVLLNTSSVQILSMIESIVRILIAVGLFYIVDWTANKIKIHIFEKIVL